MSRSWLTFEIENTEIENAENGFYETKALVLKSKAKKDLVSECKEREIFNNTIIIPTQHVDLTSGVPTDTGSASLNAVVPKPVTCVVPRTVTCVLQRKQIFVCQLNPDLSSLDTTAYIHNKVPLLRPQTAQNCGSYSFDARIKILAEMYCFHQYLSIGHAHSNAHKPPKPVTPTVFMLDKKF